MLRYVKKRTPLFALPLAGRALPRHQSAHSEHNCDTVFYPSQTDTRHCIVLYIIHNIDHAYYSQKTARFNRISRNWCNYSFIVPNMIKSLVYGLKRTDWSIRLEWRKNQRYPTRTEHAIPAALWLTWYLGRTTIGERPEVRIMAPKWEVLSHPLLALWACR